MPIYEYACGHCGHELEALQKLSDAPLVVCPECGREALVKKISAAGFRLKGGGWYETDFKSGKQKNLAGDRADSTGGGKSGETTKSTDTSSKTAGTPSKPAA